MTVFSFKSTLDKIKAVARDLTAPPEFPDVMRTIRIHQRVYLGEWANQYSWYEAHKVATSKGPRYEVYGLASVYTKKPRIKPSAGRIEDAAGNVLFTKEQTLAFLERLDAALAKRGTVERDGDHTRHYHGRYHPPGPS